MEDDVPIAMDAAMAARDANRPPPNFLQEEAFALATTSHLSMQM